MCEGGCDGQLQHFFLLPFSTGKRDSGDNFPLSGGGKKEDPKAPSLLLQQNITLS